MKESTDDYIFEYNDTAPISGKKEYLNNLLFYFKCSLHEFKKIDASSLQIPIQLDVDGRPPSKRYREASR